MQPVLGREPMTRLLAALALAAALVVGPAQGFHFSPTADLDLTYVTWST